MRLVMMGTGPFGVPTFNWLVDSDHEVVALVTQPARPARGRRKTAVSPMREAAQARGVPVLSPENVNEPNARQELRQRQPDLLVVCDYGQILSSETLATAALGGINLHGSLLPKYRGAAPVNWAIYHGETKTGVTVIHMSPKLDAGPCLAQREVEIGPDETAAELEQRLSVLGVPPVQEAIRLLAGWDGTSPIGRPQDAALVSRAPRLKKQDGLVQWSRTAKQIRDQVRAFKPWPNTFTYWRRTSGQALRLILDWVSLVEQPGQGEPPGRVVRCDGKQLWVATGQGLLAIDRIQPAGKRVMAIDAFLRGYPVGLADTFGSAEDAGN